MPDDPGARRVARLREAVDLALGGDWQAAHLIAQDREGDPLADWIHAVVHTMEGDIGNARYWYRRCGRTPRAQSEVSGELHEIRAALDGTAGPS